MGFLSKWWKSLNENRGVDLYHLGIMAKTHDKPTKKKVKRARVKGKYKADDKSTKDYNEAWVGGKAPKKKKKKAWRVFLRLEIKDISYNLAIIMTYLKISKIL